jgi:hypothetical protein
MPSLIYEIWENAMARTLSSLNFRFVLGPALSVFFAIRTGLHEAKKHCPPSLLRLLASRKQRKALLQESRRNLGNLFVFAMALDILYQAVMVYILGRTDLFLPVESLLTAFFLSVLPYLMIRGPANRLTRKLYPKKKRNP